MGSTLLCLSELPDIDDIDGSSGEGAIAGGISAPMTSEAAKDLFNDWRLMCPPPEVGRDDLEASTRSLQHTNCIRRAIQHRSCVLRSVPGGLVNSPFIVRLQDFLRTSFHTEHEVVQFVLHALLRHA